MSHLAAIDSISWEDTLWSCCSQ